MVSVAAISEMFHTHHIHLMPKVDSINLRVAENTVIKSTPPSTTYSPSIRSGSHTDIGPRRSNEDAHIHIDDLSKVLGADYNVYKSSFYAVFDGHGGSEASSYLKQHAMTLFLHNADLLHVVEDDEMFLKRSFSRADEALLGNKCIDDYCGTTALTVVILGRRLLIANAGDSRAVLCKKGVAVQISRDHRPCCLQEKKRVEEAGGFFEDGYLNGELSVTRALGDRHMKKKKSSSPLISEPEVKGFVLGEEDEFMIIGCDGIWDVMSNQEAVSLVHRQLRQNNDPQRCAKELVDQALRLHTCDNLTAIVVCFSTCYNDDVTSSQPMPPQCQPWRPKFRRSSAIIEEAENKVAFPRGLYGTTSKTPAA